MEPGDNIDLNDGYFIYKNSRFRFLKNNGEEIALRLIYLKCDNELNSPIGASYSLFKVDENYYRKQKIEKIL